MKNIKYCVSVIFTRRTPKIIIKIWCVHVIASEAQPIVTARPTVPPRTFNGETPDWAMVFEIELLWCLPNDINGTIYIYYLYTILILYIKWRVMCEYSASYHPTSDIGNFVFFDWDNISLFRTIKLRAL